MDENYPAVYGTTCRPMTLGDLEGLVDINYCKLHESQYFKIYCIYRILHVRPSGSKSHYTFETQSMVTRSHDALIEKCRVFAV